MNSGGLHCACEGDAVSVWYPDADGDGLGVDSTGVYACAQPPGYIAVGGDCDDRYASCTTDCTDADLDDMPACAPDCNDANGYCTTDCTDSDGDTYCVTHDCDETNPDTHPEAPEVNDGLDNECPGDAGHGLVDEISGSSGFDNPANLDEFSWRPQAGATSYEVARSTDRQFVADCVAHVTTATHWDDGTPVPSGSCFHYLVRATQPNLGSWGANSAGVERTPACP